MCDDAAVMTAAERPLPLPLMMYMAVAAARHTRCITDLKRERAAARNFFPGGITPSIRSKSPTQLAACGIRMLKSGGGTHSFSLCKQHASWSLNA